MSFPVRALVRLALVEVYLLEDLPLRSRDVDVDLSLFPAK